MSRFLFSVIVPVYNTEQYIIETLESVIHQTIGFMEHIQLILVNNATQDNSASICKFYRSMYPDNVIYVQLPENKGPNGARAEGLTYASGEYVNFLDSDDKWSIQAFERAAHYFSVYKNVDLIACRIRHFDAKDSWHLLDYKFETSRFVDIMHDYNFPQLSLCSTFIRRTAIDAADIDIGLKHAEDAKLLTKIILKKEHYVVLRDATFFYRTRKEGSLLQSVTKSDEWYFITPYAVYKEIQDYCKATKKVNYLYTQFLAMYDVQFRFKTAIPPWFSEPQFNEYQKAIQAALKPISDLVIFKAYNMDFLEKLRVYSVKYGPNFLNQIETDGEYFYYNGYNLLKASSQRHMEISFIDIQQEHLKIRGRLMFFVEMKKKEFYAVNERGEKIFAEYLMASDRKAERHLGDCCINTQDFEFLIPMDAPKKTVSFCIRFKGVNVTLGYSMGRFSPISDLKDDYFQYNDSVLTVDNDKLVFRRENRRDIKKYKKKWMKALKQEGRDKDLICERFIPTLKRLMGDREIWLFADRIERGGDNGEKMFRYVSQRMPRHIKPIFVISKACPDYSRIKAFGTVISPHTTIYKIVYLLATKLITAYMDNAIVYPLGEHESYLRHHRKPQIIYLQHGVIKDDFSDDQNKFNKNISMFVTSAVIEHDSLMTLPYHYLDDEVKVTGLARYDDMYDLCKRARNEEKVIIIAPTWRATMEGNVWDSACGKCAYNEKFKESEYYIFWNSLINDSRILKVMSDHKLHGILRLHPVIRTQTNDFSFNQFITAEHENKTYEQTISSCKLLITDYSSIAFDVAYIGVKTIYAQFDKNKFYLQQWYNEGYFDYETMGFGPVCYDYESTVQAMIAAIENDCVMEEKYKKRAEEFFPYRDGKCCERIYQHILEMDKEN